MMRRGKVTGVVYVDKDGKQQRQKARIVCVAGNSIESPRLLLNSASSKFPDGLANSSGQVGRNYMRHMTGSVYARLRQAGAHVSRHDHGRHRPATRQRTIPQRGFVGGYEMETLSIGLPFMAAFLDPGGVGPRRSPSALDDYDNMAGMWIVGEDMPQENNRDHAARRREGQARPAGRRTCISTTIPTTSRCATTPTRQGIGDLRGGRRHADLPDAALSVDPQSRHQPDEREPRRRRRQQVRPDARHQEPVRLGRQPVHHRRRRKPDTDDRGAGDPAGGLHRRTDVGQNDLTSASGLPLRNAPCAFRFFSGADYAPTGWRRLRRIATTDGRGGWPSLKSGHSVSTLSSVSASSAGCWTDRNSVLPSGVKHGPVASRAMRAGEEQLRQAARRAFGVDAIDAVRQVEIVGAVGRHPEPAGRIEGDVVGADEPAIVRCVRMEGRADRCVLRIAAEHEQVPLVLVGRVVGVGAAAARRDQFDDVAPEVLGARIGRVDLRLVAILVLGHHRIDAAGDRVGFDVLRAGPSGWRPSASAASRVFSSTSAWSAKPFSAVSLPWPWISGSQVIVPSASKRATESMPSSSRSLPEARVCWVVRLGRDEAVDVFEIVVVAHVDDDAAVLVEHNGGGLVRHAA